MAYSVGPVRIVDIHRMAPKSDDRFREKNAMATERNLMIPRIRVLLAPDMSSYVLPMEKIRTWEMLITMLEKLFGKQKPLDQVRITDGQGNLILKEVWEDLLEPGMSVVVDTRCLNGSNSGREGVTSVERDNRNLIPDHTARNMGHKRGSSLTSTGSIPIFMSGSKFGNIGSEQAHIPPMVFERVGDWAYSTSPREPKTIDPTSSGIGNITAISPPSGATANGRRPAVPPSLPPSTLSQEPSRSNLLAPTRPPRPPTLSPLIIPDSNSQAENPMHTMTLSPPVAPPMSSKERFAKTGGRFTAHFQALLSKRPSPKEPAGITSVVSLPAHQSGLLERWKPIENNPRKQSLSTRRGLEPPTELVFSSNSAEPKQTKNSIVRRAKSLGNIRKDDLRIRHQASPSLPFIPPVPVLETDSAKLYLAAPFTNSTVASSVASGITVMSDTSTQPTSAETSPVQDKPQPLQSAASTTCPPSRSNQTPSPQNVRYPINRSPSRSPPMSRPPTSHSNGPLHQSIPPPSKPLPKLPPALSAFPAPGPPPPLTQLPPQLFGPPKNLEVLTQPTVPPVKSGKRIGIMGSKKASKSRADNMDGLGLGISIDGNLSPSELKKERKEEKEREKREKKEKKDRNRYNERPIIMPLNVEGGKTVAIAPEL